MIFTKPAHGAFQPPAPVGGKPVVPFSPNRGYASFPSNSAYFFTNLIAGQTNYVECSNGKPDFAYNTGTMGYHTLGEGYDVIGVDASSGGAARQQLPNPYDSFAILFEAQWTRDGAGATSVLVSGITNSAGQPTIGPKREGSCIGEGYHYIGAVRCFDAKADGQLHRFMIKIQRNSVSADTWVKTAIDGVMVDQYQSNTFWGVDWVYLARNAFANNEQMLCTGLWTWYSAKDVDPVSDAAMLELTTDPWAHLVTID